MIPGQDLHSEWEGPGNVVEQRDLGIQVNSSYIGWSKRLLVH